jgi:hypothetical protein
VKAKNGKYTEKMRDYYESVIRVYEGFLHLLSRFAECAQKHENENPKAVYLRKALESIMTRPPETFYEALKEHLKRLRLAEYLEKRLDASRLLHSEFTEILDGLCAASESESFEKINRAAVEKYGKEDDRK